MHCSLQVVCCSLLRLGNRWKPAKQPVPWLDTTYVLCRIDQFIELFGILAHDLCPWRLLSGTSSEMNGEKKLHPIFFKTQSCSIFPQFSPRWPFGLKLIGNFLIQPPKNSLKQNHTHQSTITTELWMLWISHYRSSPALSAPTHTHYRHFFVGFSMCVCVCVMCTDVIAHRAEWPPPPPTSPPICCACSAADWLPVYRVLHAFTAPGPPPALWLPPIDLFQETLAADRKSRRGGCREKRVIPLVIFTLLLKSLSFLFPFLPTLQESGKCWNPSIKCQCTVLLKPSSRIFLHL